MSCKCRHVYINASKNTKVPSLESMLPKTMEKESTT